MSEAVPRSSDGEGAARTTWRSTLRKSSLTALKLIVTIGLSVWIVGLVDWHEFRAILEGTSLWILALVTAMRFGGLALSSFKWQQLLAIHAARFRFGLLLRWYLVGSFLNHFLPSSIGGDGYRIYRTWDNDRGRAAALFAVLMERTTGMAALGILGYAAAVALYLRDGGTAAASVAGLGSVALVVGLAALALSSRFRLVDRVRLTRYGKHLDGLEAFARDFRDAPRKTSVVVGASFIFHLNKLLAVWLLLFALGGVASPLQIIVALLIAELAGLVPISLGGLGVLEGSFILVMGQFGVAEEISLATMLLLRVLMIPFYLAGAVFYFFGGGRDDRTESVNAAQPRGGGRAGAREIGDGYASSRNQ